MYLGNSKETGRTLCIRTSPNGLWKTSSTKSSTQISNHSYRKHLKESRGNSKTLSHLAPDEGGVMRLPKVIKTGFETGRQRPWKDCRACWIRGKARAIVNSLSFPLVMSYESWTVRELATEPWLVLIDNRRSHHRKKYTTPLALLALDPTGPSG
jgi:hypothetical protein